jgi:RNA polymerase sigma-70 factor (ECF subfamily)
MLFSPDDLLTALPRLRRYARLLVVEAGHADAMVERMLTRARRIDRDLSATPPTLRLFALLRSVCVEEFALNNSHRSQSALHGPETDAIHTISRDRESSLSSGDDVIAKLFRLPLEQREVLALVVVERMSYDEIAALLAVPIATVFARLVAARHAVHASTGVSTATPKSAC